MRKRAASDFSFSYLLEWLGRVMFGAGIVILLFVAYQLWGTGIIEQRAQNDLEKQFQEYVEKPTTPTTAPAQPLDEGPPPPPEGNAIARMKIPKIGVDKIVVQGVGVHDLKRGPGHYPQTPMPGQKGNASIAGHRTTYGAPFNRLDEVNNGDHILVTTNEGAFQYTVQEKKIVAPGNTSVLNNSKKNLLTLTTCNPKYSAATRLIIVAELDGPAKPASPPAPETSEPDKTNTTVAGEDQTVAMDEAGLSGESSSKWPAILWGLITAAVFVFMRVLAAKWHKWPAYILLTPVLFVVMFVFFENFSRLLPANV